VLRTIGPTKTITNSIGMTLQRVPAGAFLMGSTSPEVAATLRFDPLFKPEFAEDERPQHRIQISKPFYLGTHEVTKGQFAEFVDDRRYVTDAERDGQGGDGSNPDGTWVKGPQYTWRNPGFVQTDDHPVVNVSWNDATAFCEWLGRKDGVAYRLPTEAEWEFACRAGSTTIFQSGNDPEGLASLGNVADDGARISWTGYPGYSYIAANDGFIFTSPVGHYRPNAFGLYDLHGNVGEWCSDWYGSDYYAQSSPSDPAGPPMGAEKVRRGGSWYNTPGGNRSAYRYRNVPSYRTNNLGFRVARSDAL
jgi:sulfatase modifying factor 1